MAITVLAMSGGVDSSVAAQLLLDQGHEVIGVFMRHGNDSPLASCEVKASSSGLPDRLSLPVVSHERLDHKQGCCSAQDAQDARRVADNLGITFYALNLQKEFDRIIDYFVDEYSSGRTPNPCVQCNNWIKFGKLFAYADSLGAEFVATGHYARLSEVPEQNIGTSFPRLMRGVDTSKDQSYVLFGIQRQYLKRMLLPVGGFQKSEIREMATKLGLRIADKKDSQEICFVAAGKHAQFVADQRGDAKDGNIVDTKGNVVGTHDGIERYTIGQRKGLGVAFGEPRFVVRIDAQTNEVVIGEKFELDRSSLKASNANWLVTPTTKTFSCDVQIRYNSPAVPAVVTIDEDDAKFSVEFDDPCRGVAPGQAVVCYDNNETVLGGGWID